MKSKTFLLITAMSILFPAAVMAGPDSSQLMLHERMRESQKKLEAAEKAKGAERDRMMQEHMKAMDENMKLMRDMTPPKSNMSMKERDEWMHEHQKLMQMMLDQARTRSEHEKPPKITTFIVGSMVGASDAGQTFIEVCP